MNTYHNKDIKDEHLDTIFDSLSSEESEIILSNNRITKIDKIPKSIICINLNNNYIEDINFLVGREWDTVLLSNNNLEIVLLKDIKCITLDLSENRIEELIIEDCDISTLDISNNSIKKISFINSRINDIDISVNKLKELTNYPIGIQNLRLFNNKIKKLEDLPQTLIILDISDNKLEDFPKLPLRLRKCDACKNHITFIDIINIPLTIIFLDLTENPIENKKKLLELNIETLYLNEDDEDDEEDDKDVEDVEEVEEDIEDKCDDNVSSDFSEIEIPTNVKHRFSQLTDNYKISDSSDDDNLESLLLKDKSINTQKDSEINPTIVNMFSNLRGKSFTPKIELFASSKNINMNWNLVL